MKKPLLLSFLFHVLGAFLAFYFTSDLGRDTLVGDASKIKVRTLSPKELDRELKEALEKGEVQVVQTDDRLKSDTAPETNEKVFLSKHHQQVDKNTRSARIGKFKNVLSEGLNTPPAAEKTKTAKSKNNAEGKVAKLFKIGTAAESAQSSSTSTETGRLYQPSRAPAAISRGEGFSATDDHLQDVAIGAQTLLNAREYKFYSFYERVRTRLTEQWNLELRAQIEKVLLSGSGLGGIDRVTKVVVQLDRNGQIQQTKIISTSGMEELDRAATEAFRISAPFPNPPREMIDANDTVTLRWDFIVVSSAAEGIDIQIKRDKFEGY